MMEQTLKIFCWMRCSSDVKPWPSPVFYLFIHVNDAVVSTTQICFPANSSPVWSLTTFSREWWNYSFLCPCQSQCSQHMELDMYGPDNSNDGTFGMNRNVWGSSLAWSRRFLYQHFWTFSRTSVRESKMNAVACAYLTFQISNIQRRHIYIYIYVCYDAMAWWRHDMETLSAPVDFPHRWTSNEDFVLSLLLAIKQIVELPVVWIAIRVTRRHCNDNGQLILPVTIVNQHKMSNPARCSDT